MSAGRLTTDARQQLEELAQTSAARLLASTRYTERQSRPYRTDSTRWQAAGIWSLDIYHLRSSLAPDIVPNGLASQLALLSFPTGTVNAMMSRQPATIHVTMLSTMN